MDDLNCLCEELARKQGCTLRDWLPIGVAATTSPALNIPVRHGMTVRNSGESEPESHSEHCTIRGRELLKDTKSNSSPHEEQQNVGGTGI